MLIDIAVILLTYNHGKYISSAIQSVIDQSFSGHFKLFVYDDLSTDNTYEIASSFQINYPDKIFVIQNTQNLGLAHNFARAVSQANSSYIAYLEGDDYWTDSNKLQIQFNFLETNPNFVLAFHDFVTIDEKNQLISDRNLFNKKLQRNRSKKDMVIGCLIHQNTMMFRNVIQKLPNGFFLSRNHDTFFIAYLAFWGEAGYVKCKPLHYRIHKESLWSSLSGREKHWNGLITYFLILGYVSPKYYWDLIWKIGSKIKSFLIS